MGWLLVVPMTAVLPPARICRSYRFVSWWTMTTETVSGRVWPVLVLVARTLSPGFRLAMGTALPEASRTRVPGVKLFPPTTQDSAASSTTWLPAFSAASSPACSATLRPTSTASPSPTVPTVRATVRAALAQPARLGWVTQDTTSWAPEYLYAALATAAAARLMTCPAAVTAWPTFLATLTTALAMRAILRASCLA